VEAPRTAPHCARTAHEAAEARPDPCVSKALYSPDPRIVCRRGDRHQIASDRIGSVRIASDLFCSAVVCCS